MCSIFRNEGAGVASEMIRDAMAATRYDIGDPPPLGMVTFINPKCVKPTKVRGHDVYGWSFVKAGFREVGMTKEKLIALQIMPCDMPEARPALGSRAHLFG
jgi:hypothetical protein